LDYKSAEANLKERRRLILTILDVIYVDAKEERCIVGIKPKLPLIPILQIATTCKGSGVI